MLPLTTASKSTTIVIVVIVIFITIIVITKVTQMGVKITLTIYEITALAELVALESKVCDVGWSKLGIPASQGCFRHGPLMTMRF